jgi:pimeloyl-ACP methyl ester carboxylesterase
MATFVLVHGAWHGGWCYQRVATILREQGHQVLTPTLSGLGEYSHLYSASINVSTHIQDIVNVLEFERLDNVVLVGHSYGGLVIAGVSDRLRARIAKVVYLDAYLGEDNESLFDLDPELLSMVLDGVKDSGGHTLQPVPAATFAVNEADQEWVDATCTPQSFATFAERIRLSGAYKTFPDKIYVCSAWKRPIFRQIVERLKPQPGWEFLELPCGHSVMLDMPKETAAILLDAARNLKP